MSRLGESTCSRRSLCSITLKFENVAYQLPTRSNNPSNFNTDDVEQKWILRGVSGQVTPGELLVMLGPSGSGKTTLLSSLGGRLPNQNLTGSITYNNKPISSSSKRNIGFVTQEDVFYPHLTVFETLYYTALLRLPNSLTKYEKVEQTSLVIDQLGLTKCRNGIIKDVSGGERKRVSIGQEMLVNPSLLLLDEPTSGLDSTTAQRIVTMLKDFTVINNRTLVMTIHQPSSRLFYMFHKILLLSDGVPLYFGKGSDVIDYFSGVGFSPEIAMNPSDFLLDLTNGIASKNGGENEGTTEEVKHKLTSAYLQNIHPILTQDFKEKVISQSIREAGNIAKDELAWCTSWWTQFQVLLRREIKEHKHGAFSLFTVAQVLFLAILTSILWWQSQTRVDDQIGLLFFITIKWSFFPLYQSVYAFPSKRAMIEKERMSGTYRLSSYFASSMICDLPLNLTLPTIFLLIVYWSTGLKSSFVAFLETFFVLLLVVLVSNGFGLALGALFMDLEAATTLGTIIMISSMMVGGFFVKSVPTYISWIKYLFVGYHSFKLFVDAQFSKAETYDCGVNGSCLVRDLSSLDFIKLGVGTWSSVLALLVMFVGFRLVAYFALKRLGKVN